jgi:hypothetical protein
MKHMNPRVATFCFWDARQRGGERGPAVGSREQKEGSLVCGFEMARVDPPRKARLEMIASQALLPTLNALYESVQVWWQADEAI